MVRVFACVEVILTENYCCSERIENSYLWSHCSLRQKRKNFHQIFNVTNLKICFLLKNENSKMTVTTCPKSRNT